MTNLTFTINNVDFSDIVAKHEYTTYYTPVEGKSYTDLNMVKHVNYTRYRGGLLVKINPLSSDRAQALYTQLTTQPCTVSYFSFQRNEVVTETMETVGISLKDGFAMASKTWAVPSSLEFIQL